MNLTGIATPDEPRATLPLDLDERLKPWYVQWQATVNGPLPMQITLMTTAEYIFETVGPHITVEDRDLVDAVRLWAKKGEDHNVLVLRVRPAPFVDAILGMQGKVERWFAKWHDRFSGLPLADYMAKTETLLSNRFLTREGYQMLVKMGTPMVVIEDDEVVAYLRSTWKQDVEPLTDEQVICCVLCVV